MGKWKKRKNGLHLIAERGAFRTPVRASRDQGRCYAERRRKKKPAAETEGKPKGTVRLGAAIGGGGTQDAKRKDFGIVDTEP